MSHPATFSIARDPLPDHEQKQAALSYLNEAWAEARHDGVDGDCLAQASLFTALAELVSTYGEDAVGEIRRKSPDPRSQRRILAVAGEAVSLHATFARLAASAAEAHASRRIAGSAGVRYPRQLLFRRGADRASEMTRFVGDDDVGAAPQPGSPPRPLSFMPWRLTFRD